MLKLIIALNVCGGLYLLIPFILFAQQVPDTTGLPEIDRPAYSMKEGPVICIDAAHGNFHRLTTGYAPFAAFLQKDGYRLASNEMNFENGVSPGCQILVIANALHQSNLGNWVLPTPSAFTEKEIEHLETWVSEGGRLLLIADHMPFPGAAEELAATFGFTFNNGFALNPERLNFPSIFKKQDGTLHNSPVTREIDSVATYTGQAFEIPSEAIPVLTFANDHYTLMPDTAWRFSADTPQESVEGWSQGAIMHQGKGRLAVFGEAAAFTAQNVGDGTQTVGLTDPYAAQNARFLLNVIHWLDPNIISTQ